MASETRNSSDPLGRHRPFRQWLKKFPLLRGEVRSEEFFIGDSVASGAPEESPGCQSFDVEGSVHETPRVSMEPAIHSAALRAMLIRKRILWSRFWRPLLWNTVVLCLPALIVLVCVGWLYVRKSRECFATGPLDVRTLSVRNFTSEGGEVHATLNLAGFYGCSTFGSATIPKGALIELEDESGPVAAAALQQAIVVSRDTLTEVRLALVINQREVFFSALGVRGKAVSARLSSRFVALGGLVNQPLEVVRKVDLGETLGRPRVTDITVDPGNIDPTTGNVAVSFTTSWSDSLVQSVHFREALRLKLFRNEDGSSPSIGHLDMLSVTTASTTGSGEIHSTDVTDVLAAQLSGEPFLLRLSSGQSQSVVDPLFRNLSNFMVKPPSHALAKELFLDLRPGSFRPTHYECGTLMNFGAHLVVSNIRADAVEIIAANLTVGWRGAGDMVAQEFARLVRNTTDEVGLVVPASLQGVVPLSGCVTSKEGWAGVADYAEKTWPPHGRSVQEVFSLDLEVHGTVTVLVAGLIVRVPVSRTLPSVVRKDRFLGSDRQGKVSRSSETH
mmetsp:Transcript_31211/g.83052  ORF Transcript_31211/g.83052 Transcript_31211/m.83052 type:complete len:558 (-) Transcript_31211:222-1895(-)